MSLTKLHTRRKHSPDEVRTANAHFLLTEYAAEHEDELLRKVHRAYTVEGTPFDGGVACRVVATYLGGGASFLEALVECCFYLDREGHFFHWRRNDLISWRPTLPAPASAPRRRKAEDRKEART